MGTIVAHGRRELGWMAFAAVFVFVIWMYQVRLFIALMLGTKSFVSFRDFLLVVITTPEGWIFLIVEHLIGAVLSFLLFSLTVVSFPLLLDRDVDIVTAMITSVRAVVASPGPMIGWAAGNCFSADCRLLAGLSRPAGRAAGARSRDLAPLSPDRAARDVSRYGSAVSSRLGQRRSEHGE